MAVRAATLAMTFIVFAASAWAKVPAGSVKVRVVRLDGAPDTLKGHLLSVKVLVGDREIDRTPAARAEDARWDRGLRAYTAAAKDLVFGLMDGSPGAAADASAPHGRGARVRDQDEALGTGFKDLVADYGTGRLDEGADSAGQRRKDLVADAASLAPVPRRGTVELCRAAMSWPPSDGEHRLDCVGMTLVINTKRL